MNIQSLKSLVNRFERNQIIISVLTLFTLSIFVDFNLYIALFLYLLGAILIIQVRLFKKRLFKYLIYERHFQTKQRIFQIEERELVCRQIYHDLASPLGLLKISITKLEDQNIAKPFALSIDRLIKISEDLKSQKYIWPSKNPAFESLKVNLDKILEEKRLLTSCSRVKFDVHLSPKALTRTMDMPTEQIQKVLSYVLDRAILSVYPNGTIKVLARNSTGHIDLVIADSGQSSEKDFLYVQNCLEAFGGKMAFLKTKKEPNYTNALLLRLPVLKASI